MVDVTEDMKHALNEQFNKYGVQIIDVAIQRVRLPQQFEKQMEERTTYGAVIEEQKMKQLSDMQKIQQGEQIRTVQQRHHEDEEKEREVGKRAVTEIKKKLDGIVAETQKMIAAIAEEEAAATREIKAQNDLLVQKLESETLQIKTQFNAKAKADAEKLRADADAFCMKKLAEANLYDEQCKAKSKAAIAQAEGAAAKMLRKKRQYELQKHQIAMYSALADNPNVVVTGTSGGQSGGQSLLADMMVSQKQSQIMLNVDANKR